MESSGRSSASIWLDKTLFWRWSEPTYRYWRSLSSPNAVVDATRFLNATISWRSTKYASSSTEIGLKSQRSERHRHSSCHATVVAVTRVETTEPPGASSCNQRLSIGKWIAKKGKWDAEINFKTVHARDKASVDQARKIARKHIKERVRWYARHWA